MINDNEIKQRIRLINSRISLLAGLKDKSVRFVLKNSGLESGKRIRGLLVILTAELFDSASTRRAADVAAAIEVFHNATLIHDDIVDNAKKRRGAKTLDRAIGRQMSVLTGDYLFAYVVGVVIEAVSPEILRYFAGTVKDVCCGEIDEAYNKGNVRLLEKEYFDIISKKTASLIEASVKMGAAIAGAGLEAQKSLAMFGKSIGLAFQIKDDILDITGNARRIGKPVANDIKEGKATLPFILALRAAPVKERIKIEKFFVAKKSLEILAFIKKYRGIEMAEEKAGLLTKTAIEYLRKTKVKYSPNKEILENLANYLLARNY